MNTFKIDFDKSYDKMEWTFIIDMLSYLDFGSKCVDMINTLFSSLLAFVAVNNILSLCILLHHSIVKGCPLAPYRYVLTTNALGYLLENDHVHG